MMTTELRQRAANLMRGELTFTGLDFFLIAAVLLLAGICIGLLTAPFTHGLSFFSHNGNYNGNNCGNHETGSASDAGDAIMERTEK